LIGILNFSGKVMAEAHISFCREVKLLSFILHPQAVVTYNKESLIEEAGAS
jgi:hypothetical protein